MMDHRKMQNYLEVYIQWKNISSLNQTFKRHEPNVDINNTFDIGYLCCSWDRIHVRKYI